MTLPTAHLFSEPFGAMGNVVAEGVWNQLGRPELDRLTLLIRESAQNSWDARTGQHIRYSIDGLSLNPTQVDAYARFFARQPGPGAYSPSSKIVEQIESIASWLEGKSVRLLVVSDRGTTGLDGPTRADLAVDDGSRRNFVDFLRNIGQPPGRAHTGGTFGYGKAALYLASKTRTIVVYTRCIDRGQLESRLTAAALTHNYAEGNRRYTGRHWWGAGGANGIAEPFVGRQADLIALDLGLPGFTGDECGTTVAITAPAFDDGELNQLGNICVRHLWPKLKAPNGGRPPITLSVMVSGVPVVIPDPAKTAPYDAFWRAYCALRKGERHDVKYYSEAVGHLALERTLMLGRGDASSNSPEHEVRPQHVALLRTPELVVKYLDAGRGVGNDQFGFVGVFQTSEAFDEVFAQSEPPTHDDWQPSSVSDKRARGIVNTSLKKIREHCREYAALNSPRVHGAEGAPLAKLANEFAVLAPGIQSGASSASEAAGGGGSSGEKPARSGKVRRKSRPQVTMDDQPTSVEEIDGKPFAVFGIDITHAEGSDESELSAEVYVVVSGGGREVESPKGKTPPRISHWLSPRGSRFEGDKVRVGPRQQGCWKLYVPIEDNVAIEVVAEAQAKETA